MPEWFPPRPRYSKERALFGYPVLAAFVLLLLFRLANVYLPFDFGAIGNTLLAATAVFLLPSLIFIRVRGKGYTRALRFHRPYATHIPLLLFALFALFSGMLLLSILFGGIDSLGNTTAVYEQLLPETARSILLMIPVYAVLPAVLEELLFRGILCTELDRRGVLRSVLVSSLLFSLIHFDLANLPVYFFAGILLTLTLYATDSLPATMILHASYNILSLFSQRYLNTFYHFTGGVELFLLFFILLFLVSALFFCRECARLYAGRAESGARPPRRDIPRNVQLYTMLDALCEWPVVLCMILSVLGFILL